MPTTSAITILHLSDLQFGKSTDAFPSLQGSLLVDDLAKLKSATPLHPQLIVVSGDLSRSGSPKEFENARHFLERLTTLLKLTPDRVVLVPGNHDVNRMACQAYFNACSANDEKPVPPFSPKWKNYDDMCRRFYQDSARVYESPWHWVEIPDLKVVVAPLNSTLAEIHAIDTSDPLYDELIGSGEFGHFGWLGGEQLRWFSEKLAKAKEQQWVRIGVVHHYQQDFRNSGGLRDADSLRETLGSYVNLLIHGHVHTTRPFYQDGWIDSKVWMSKRAPCLSMPHPGFEVASNASDKGFTQYQVVQIERHRLRQWTRRLFSEPQSWTSEYYGPEISSSELEIELEAVEATFPKTVEKRDLFDRFLSAYQMVLELFGAEWITNVDRTMMSGSFFHCPGEETVERSILNARLQKLSLLATRHQFGAAELTSSLSMLLQSARKPDRKKNKRDRINRTPPLGPLVPQALVSACADGNCVLYVGGGLVYMSGSPSWRDVLTGVIDYAETQSSNQASTAGADSTTITDDFHTRWDPLRPLVAAGTSLPYVAELIAARLPRETLAVAVAAALGKATVVRPVIYNVLDDVPFSGIIDANWDRVFAEGYIAKHFVMLTPSNREQFAPLLRDKLPFYLRLWGSPEQSDSFVFTPEELRRAMYENDSLSRFVTSIVFSKTLLFLGSSVEGVEQFLSTIRIQSMPGRHHFAVVTRIVGAEMEIWAERFATKYGVTLIFADDARTDSGRHQLTAFAEDLRDRVRERNKKIRALDALEKSLENAIGLSPASIASTSVSATTLHRVVLENIGPFTHLDLPLNDQWNVILGNNGCGKSTLLKAVALGLCGDDEQASRAGMSLLRDNAASGFIELRIDNDVYRTELYRDGAHVRIKSPQLTPLQAGRWVVLGFPTLRGVSTANSRGPSSDGGVSPNPVVGDLLPLLVGGVDTRADSLKQWLINLIVRSKPGDLTDRGFADYSRHLRETFFEVLADLTPSLHWKFDHLDEQTWQLFFKTADGIVPIEQLSQGTSAVFSWVGTLLQRMYQIHRGISQLQNEHLRSKSLSEIQLFQHFYWLNTDRPQNMPALVLVDEVDTHMHPEWQYMLVPLLKEHFPRLQVLATSHSPLVAGNMESKELIRLRRADPTGAVEVVPLHDSIEGWRADQILTSPAFGLDTTRNIATRKLHDRYRELAARDNLETAEQFELESLANSLKIRLSSAPERAEAKEAYEMIRLAFQTRLQSLSVEHRQLLLNEIYVQVQEAITGSARPQ